MTLFRLLLLSCLAFAATSGSGFARCAGAVMLGGFHDAYRATLEGDEDARKRGAMSLLVFLGGQDTERLAQQVSRSGIELDVDRLSKVLADARTLADASWKGISTLRTVTRHEDNVEWLADIYFRTGCRNSASASSRSPKSGSGGTGAFSANAFGPQDRMISKDSGMLLVAVALALLIAIGIGSYKFSTSFFMRRRMVERLPRFPVAFELELTYTDPDGDMKQATGDVIDLSQGGVKLSWPDPPPSKTLVTVELLATQRLAQVMWSNNHFAGLMFEERLTRPELKSLTDTNPPA